MLLRDGASTMVALNIINIHVLDAPRVGGHAGGTGFGSAMYTLTLALNDVQLENAASTTKPQLNATSN